MLEYVKTILKKVSFDSQLFEKELRKALNTLLHDELLELKNWCYKHFHEEHEIILQRCFVSI